MKINLDSLLTPCINLSKQAGKAILNLYQKPNELQVDIKQDKTPVTEADLQAHAIIIAGLKKLTPDIPVLSEEDAKIDFSIRQSWNYYWLVDPLDGTKEFIHGTDDFTVNIALIHQGQSILGVIYAPYFDTVYFAARRLGCFKQTHDLPPQPIQTRLMPRDECIVVVSRRHSVTKSKTFLTTLPQHTILMRGSSLKTCLIAEGVADLYPCLGDTSEWDMGAAQCIITEAGGAMYDLQLQPIQFNQKESLVNPPLLVVGDRSYHWRKLLNQFLNRE